MSWGFYGRSSEQVALRAVLGRRRWFFAKVTGRRRIGKTSLIRQALASTVPTRDVLYCQIPDSGPAGVLSAVADAMEAFRLPAEKFPPPTTLPGLARMIGDLARAGYIVALDEFQYFNRERLREFTSHLQAEVDRLSAEADRVPGGLVVLGSLFTEMTALLNERSAPLFNRVTDELPLTHLEPSAVRDLLRAHDAYDPSRLLLLWTLFEGVPKFYRDCFEQGVLKAGRNDLVERMFFRSSSPLRDEAEHWFLKELHGRYDAVLKFLARRPGASHGDIVSHLRERSPESQEQIGGHLKVLAERYAMVERRTPAFARPSARRGRYYVVDNFLTAWLAALRSPVAALAFRPVEELVADASERLAIVEGRAFERLTAKLLEERGRKGVGEFALSRPIAGYWGGADVEIDVVAVDDAARRLILGSCKRNAARLWEERAVFDGHVARFLVEQPQFREWRLETFVFAPTIDPALRRRLEAAGRRCRDLGDLLDGLN